DPCAIAPNCLHALDEAEPSETRTISHVAGHPGNKDENLGRVAEREVPQSQIGQRIIGNVIDKNNDQRYAATKVESAIAFPFFVHQCLVTRLLRARSFFTCSAAALNPPKN